MKKLAKLTLVKETLHALEREAVAPVRGGVVSDTVHPTGGNTGSSNTSFFCSAVCTIEI